MARRSLKIFSAALVCGLVWLAAPGPVAAEAGAAAAPQEAAANATAADTPTAIGHSTEVFLNSNATAGPEISGRGEVTGQLPIPDGASFKDPLSQPDPSLFSWSGYLKGIGLLFVILASLWLVVWLLRRKGALPGMGGLPRDMFSVEAQIALGPKKRLLLVRFLNSRLLLGVTDHHITMLKEVTEGPDGREESGNTGVVGFAEIIAAAGQKNDAS